MVIDMTGSQINNAFPWGKIYSKCLTLYKFCHPEKVNLKITPQHHRNHSIDPMQKEFQMFKIDKSKYPRQNILLRGCSEFAPWESFDNQTLTQWFWISSFPSYICQVYAYTASQGAHFICSLFFSHWNAMQCIVYIRMFHKKICFRFSTSIWGLLWRNPKVFLMWISFRGCTSHFRFDLFVLHCRFSLSPHFARQSEGWVKI